MNGLVLRKSGVGIGNLRWSFVSGIGGFLPPLTYGELPTGATQAWPLAGALPDSLEIGEEYTLGLIDAVGDTAFYIFERTAR